MLATARVLCCVRVSCELEVVLLDSLNLATQKLSGVVPLVSLAMAEYIQAVKHLCTECYFATWLATTLRPRSL